MVADEQLLSGSEASSKQNGGDYVRLKRSISLFSGCSIIIGTIIGSGIFVSPKGVIVHAGSVLASIVIWFLCGVYSMLGALCYAELGTSIPKSGGDYAYIYEAFGALPAFLFLWISVIIVSPTSNAVMALTCANYILTPFFANCEVPDNAVRLVAACVLLFITFVNCYNVEWATKTQNISMITKVAALSTIVVAAVIYVLLGNIENFEWSNVTENTQLSPAAIALAFYSGVFSFSGWNYLNFVTEELKSPYKYVLALSNDEEFRNLPRAIYISIPLVTLIYVLVNAAYFSVLSADEVLDSNAVAVSFAERFMGYFALLVPVFVAMSCIGSVNGITFTSARMFFVGARNGHLPELLSMININYLTPMPSLFIVGGFSVAMLAISDIYALINYLAFAETAVVTMAVAGLIVMRWTKPDMKRPIKVNIIIPIIFVLMCLFILLTPFVPIGVEQKSPIELIISLSIILSGVPIYYLFVAWEDKPRSIYQLWIDFTRFVQKLLYCVPDEERDE